MIVHRVVQQCYKMDCVLVTLADHAHRVVQQYYKVDCVLVTKSILVP